MACHTWRVIHTMARSTCTPPHLRHIHSSYSTPASIEGIAAVRRLPLESIIEHVTPSIGLQLTKQHFAVVDGLLGTAAATGMRQEILSLHQGRMMHLNSTHLVRASGTQLLVKRGIWEAELREATVQAAAPLCAQLQTDATLRTMIGLHLPSLQLQSQAVKLQYNAGDGACFPIHVDSEESLDGRRLTAILYLNPGWQESHGGQLRLYPSGSQPVDVAPLHDRLVVFESPRLLHRVLPSSNPRCCLTVWMSENKMNQGTTRPLRPALAHARAALRQHAQHGGTLPSDTAAELLRDLEIVRHLGRLRHCEEWATSIQESHHNSEATRAELARFWHENGIISRALKPLTDVISHSPSGSRLSLLDNSGS